jgi:RecA/RadA recombinase
MDATLRSALAAPGRVTNIWGKSGAGKTSLALDIAMSEIQDVNGKVLYITDDPPPVVTRLAAPLPDGDDKNRPGTHLPEDFVLIRSPTFKNLGELVQQLPFAFLPDETSRESVEFKNFVDAGENDINEKVIESFKPWKPPSMVVIDEITREYKRQSIVMEDPGPLNLQLVTQLGFLKAIAVEKGIKVIVTSATRTIAGAIGGSEEPRFIDVPIANDVLDHYIDIDAQLQWTRRVGERNIIITDANGRTKQQHHVIDMNILHNRLAGGTHP